MNGHTADEFVNYISYNWEKYLISLLEEDW